MKISQETMLKDIASEYSTPVWVYDASVIRSQIRKLRNFDVIRFAQKSCSNTHILRLMRDEGVFIDAVSAGEIIRSFAAGYSNVNNPGSIVYTSDVIDDETIELVKSRKIAVNAGSLDMINKIGLASSGHPVWLRVNPGFGHGHSHKTNTGGPNSKHGIWHTEIHEAVKLISKYNLKLEGVHMHIGSGSDLEHLSRVCKAMFEVVTKIDQPISAISAGGGLPIQYRESDEGIDVSAYFELWNNTRKQIEDYLGKPVKLEIEPGRFLVGGSGKLISKVQCIKSTPEHEFILVDAGFNDLVRPSMYGSYHDIGVIQQNSESSHVTEWSKYVVAGPLCESGDVFTQDQEGTILERSLPRTSIGDLVVFHDVGGYGSSMSSNYNSRPLAPEILYEGEKYCLIRKRQLISDLLALEKLSSCKAESR